MQLVNGRGTYGNGSIDWGQEGLTVGEILARTGVVRDERVLAAFVNGELVTLDKFISHDCQLIPVTAKSEEGWALLQRTAIFLLAYSIVSLGRGYQRLGGGRVAKRVYYDFLPPEQGITSADWTDSQRIMEQALAAKMSITAKKLSYYSAVHHFERLGEREILRRLEYEDDGGAVSVQIMGDFVEPDTGVVLSSLEDLSMVRLLDMEAQERGWRIWAQVLG